MKIYAIVYYGRSMKLNILFSGMKMIRMTMGTTTSESEVGDKSQNA